MHHYPIFSYSSNPNFAHLQTHPMKFLRNSPETSKLSLSFNFRHCPFNPQLLVAVISSTSRGPQASISATITYILTSSRF